MKYLIFVLIGYAVMYVIVWLHEIGHSVVDYKCGVKKNWLRVNVKPKLRVPNIAVGLLATVLYVVVLIKTPSEIRCFVVVWNLITVVSMCMGRIVFTIKANKRK